MVVSDLSILGPFKVQLTQCWRFNIVTLIWIIATIPMLTGETITAVPADSFVESIGVNTHWGYPNVYTHNYTGLKAKLAESGIRYVRDGTFPAVFVRANDLYNSLGIKTNMLTGRYKPGPWPQPLDTTKIDAELNDIKNLALAATVALEAPNEYDLAHGPDTDWVGNIKNYSILLYTKAKADSMLRNLPVIAPSFTSFEAYQVVGNSDPYIDYGNQHFYYWTYWPGFNGYDSNGTRSITWYLDYLAPQQSPSGKRVQGTEAGHTNYIQTGGVSEEADGKYMARIFAEFFRRGIYRTYKYELVDQALPDREGFFGLLRNDLSEKAPFRAVKNLIAILSDKGSSFTPSTLNYVLSGSMNNVRQILFQKRNGDFYLMVWLEVASWDVNAKIDLYPPAQSIVLTLQGITRISDATLYTFNNNADVNTFNLTVINNQVILNVTDKISIIRLRSSTNSISHGIYRLTPKTAPHICLNSAGDQKHAFVNLSQYWGGFNQQWILEPVGDDFYRLINRAGHRVLNVYDCNAYDGGVVQLYDWLGTECQKWKFERLPDGYYRVTPKHAQGQCLDVKLCSLAGGIAVQQWSWSNSDCQHWKLDWIAPTI